VSVTALVTYTRCPRQCLWSVVEPLPRPARPAARIGSLLHGWIERRASGQGSLLTGGEDEALGADAARLQALRESFLGSPYGDLLPLAVERAFAVMVGDHCVRGRVDALYRRDSGIEVVDFKTGRPPAPDDASAGFQLDLYALAAVDAWGYPAGEVQTTEWYLEAGRGTSRDFSTESAILVRRRLAEALEAFADRRFDPLPGSYCSRCDFLASCPPGRRSSGL
jgi:DNA helicase-2/ATP-dependent DNA helicase PcrA